MKLTLRFILIGFFYFITSSLSGQPLNGEHLQISLLTCSPSDIASYTLYGHTSVRVKDTTSLNADFDIVFNYGIFEFSKPNFIYRFAKGETDYKLEYYNTADFLVEYQLRNSEIYEQILNLTAFEKETIFQKLIVNARPENRVYRYNFFYDNCSTRPEVIIRESLTGTIHYPDLAQPVTFRDMINHCTRFHPWITFGCDLIIGYPADQAVSVQESFFIPDYLKNAYTNAAVTDSNGTKRKLVASERILTEAVPEDPIPASFFTPLLCSLLFFGIIILFMLWEWSRKARFRWLDFILFLAAGLAGCILFFLSFISEHPAMWPNIWILWLHPFHLIGSVLFVVKKLNKAAYCYHFINFAALLLMCALCFFVPQHINWAFIPLIATLSLRSGSYLFRKI